MTEHPSYDAAEHRPHPHLAVRREGPVLHVRLDNPTRRNAQTPSLWLALAEVARTIPDDVRVVVLTGTGPTFSAGLDRSMLTPGGVSGEPDLIALCVTDPDGAATTIGRYQEAFTLWRDAKPLVVAAVQGHAVGAGFQLALGADLRIVADDVQFRMAETSLGLVPDLGGTAALVELLGYPRALELCVTSRSMGAAEAVATGLATLAVPATELASATADLVAALLAAPPAAAVATKLLLSRAGSTPRAQQLAAERSAQTVLIGTMARAMRGMATGGGTDDAADAGGAR
ncbi:MAG: enoyl-CoA hydratase/isomerase family protein [Austwickia sp.]|nr:enoyl-CoA hydratase/isomerase family protein [Austwickia sp.]